MATSTPELSAPLRSFATSASVGSASSGSSPKLNSNSRKMKPPSSSSASRSWASFWASRRSGQPGTAPPDGAWRDGDQLWLLFEAKTEEKAANPVSVDDARQAASHHDWVESQLEWETPAESLTSLVTYKTTVHPAAAGVARDVALVDPTTIRGIAGRAITLHQEIRPRARGLLDEQLAAAVAREFQRQRLRSDDLISELGRQRVADT